MPRFVHLSVLGMLVLVAVLAQGAVAADNTVTSSATGSGHMVRPDGSFRSFSFSARKHADGTVDGQMQLNSRGFDVFVHIEIDCLRVVGNVAYMTCISPLLSWDYGEPRTGAPAAE